MTNKLTLYNLCLDQVTIRMQSAQDALELLQADANNETKSSAGDKYETGRAMVQLEMEQHTQQLNEATRQKQVLQKLDIHTRHTSAQPGSVIITDQGNYFLAIPAGQLKIGDTVFFAITVSSPIGAKLLKVKAGDDFSLNNRHYKVLEVY